VSNFKESDYLSTFTAWSRKNHSDLAAVSIQQYVDAIATILNSKSLCQIL